MNGGETSMRYNSSSTSINERQATYAASADQLSRSGIEMPHFRIGQQAPLLFRLFMAAIARPGLSIEATIVEQLRLIAGVASYVQAVTKGGIAVYGLP